MIVGLACAELKLLGPLHVKVAPPVEDDANKLIGEPAHNILVAALAVGAVGAPGLVMEYGPKFLIQLFPSFTCRL